jgi:hypothetical protein
LIKKEIEAKKIENLDYSNKSMRILNDGAIVHHPPQRLVESVPVSERIDVIVTRPNPKEAPK